MGVAGVGTDIIRVERIGRFIARWGEKGVARLFTAAEIAYCRRYSDPVVHFAGRFAAKEAVAKAIGTGMTEGVSFSTIEIASNNARAPLAILSGAALAAAKGRGIGKIHLSITHDGDYAVAFAVCEGSA
ncbi:MAG: holo-ACP synthase [Candidatus Brocadiia bacterium]